jgi:hypothetical protein
VNGHIAVCDASSLIALTQIDRLWLLPRLFETVVVPPAVALEAANTVSAPNWFVSHAPPAPIDIRILEASLDAGEIKAIAASHSDSAKALTPIGCVQNPIALRQPDRPRVPPVAASPRPLPSQW